MVPVEVPTSVSPFAATSVNWNAVVVALVSVPDPAFVDAPMCALWITDSNVKVPLFGLMTIVPFPVLLKGRSAPPLAAPAVPLPSTATTRQVAARPAPSLRMTSPTSISRDSLGRRDPRPPRWYGGGTAVGRSVTRPAHLGGTTARFEVGGRPGNRRLLGG